MPPARHTRQQASQESAGRGAAVGHASDGEDSDDHSIGPSQPRRASQRIPRHARQASKSADHEGDSTIVPSESGNSDSRRVSVEDDTGEDDPNHVKILLATDNHVGYMEKDPIRGRDSINTFREILQLAVKHEVDFVLLGGDLFHENRPSRTAMHQVMGALREFTLGDKPVSIELLSDPNDGQPDGYNFPAINYEDSNLNVAIPVFSIHGNHDDPQGIGSEGALSAVDLLSVTGLINYFGKIELPSSDALAAQQATRAPSKGGLSDVGIRIRPVLLQKGDTKVALYGMGNIKDERMHFELRNNRVRMYRPREDSDDWFNILTVHQNRVGHDPKAVVPETMFDDSVHLVVWGHEHEQRLKPEPVAGKRYHISQPGSSVATSLMPGEAVDKKVGIIHIRGRSFHIEPLDLKTVRPFVEDTVDLDEILQDEGIAHEDKPALNKIFVRKVSELIEFSRKQWEERYADVPEREKPKRMLPLIRVRVQYTRMDAGTFVRFGQNFVDKVANPKDILHFTKKKAPPKKKNEDQGDFQDPQEGMVPSEKLEKTRMSDLTKTYLRAQTLQLLDSRDLDHSVTLFVDKDDNSAISSIVKKGLKTMRDGLVKTGSDERRMLAELDRIRESRNRRDENDDDAQSANGGDRGAASDDEDDFMRLAMDDMEQSTRSMAPSSTATQKKAASSSSRGLSSTRTQSRGKGAPSPSQRTLVFRGNSESEDDDPHLSDDEVMISQPPHVQAKSRAAPTAAQKKSAPAPSQPARRRTGGRAAAQRASSRFVESQAQDGDDDDDFEMSLE